jgi:putative oxidoreductase
MDASQPKASGPKTGDRAIYMDVLMVLARFLAGGYFIWAGTSKLGNPSAFWSQIMGYNMASARQSRFLASVLPALEATTGLFFASGLYPFSTGAILLAMLVVFSIAISVSLARGMENDCGCGSRSSKVRPILLVRNLGLAGLVAVGMFSHVPPYIGAVVIAGIGLALIVGSSVTNYRRLGV